MRRLGLVLGVLSLVVAACGGGEATTPATAAPVALADVVDAATLSAIDVAIDALGPEGAFEAVVFAMDDGYDPDQITAAMATGSLDQDGSIPGVTPTYQASNLIDRSGPSAYGDLLVLAAGPDLVLAQGQVSIKDVKDNFLPDLAAIFGIDAEAERARPELSREAGRTIIGTIVFLAQVGYSGDQIVEHLVLGTEPLRIYVSGPLCPTISDRGKLVAPENDAVFAPGHPCIAYYDGLRFGETPTTTPSTEATTGDTSAADTTISKAAGDYSFSARLEVVGEVEWVWTGAFSIVGDQLVGAGSVAGSADTTCSVEGGPEYPVAYTGSGAYDITGTAGASSMLVVLSPTAGNVDVTTGDTSQLCVDVSIDIAETLAQFPMGNVELTEIMLEFPLEGGPTSIDFGGFVFEVTVAAN